MSVTMISQQMKTVIRRLSDKYDFSYDDAIIEVQNMDFDITHDDKRKTPSRPRKQRITDEEKEEAKRLKEEAKLAKKKAKEEAKEKAKEEAKMAREKAKEEAKLAKKKAKEEAKLAKEEAKLAKKKAKGYKYPLPFLGVIGKNQCQGIKLNYGLHTQCGGKKTSNEFCITCNKAIDKSDTKKHPYGIISDRLDKDGNIVRPFYDNKGGKTICYNQYLLKMKHDVDDVKTYFEQENVDIPEFYWDEEIEEGSIKKRGRPKKQKSLTDSSDEDLANAISNIVREDDTDDDEVPHISSADSNSITSGITNDEQDDKSVSVVRIVIDGSNYLLSDDNEIYDETTEDLVGYYDKKTKKITPHKIEDVVDDIDN